MSDDTKLKIDDTLDELIDEADEELDEEDEDTDGSGTMMGTAPDLESDDDPEAALEEMVGEIDNTKPFTIGDRINKSEKSRHGQS